MRKFQSALLISLVFLLSLNAKEVKLATAQKMAIECFKEMLPSKFNSNSNSSSNGLVLLDQRIINQKAVLYVFSNSQKIGYVVISGEDQTVPVLAFSDDYEFAPLNGQIAPGLESWINKYANEILDLRQEQGYSSKKSHPDWSNNSNAFSFLKSGKSVSPLLPSTWNQGCYYNQQCPSDYQGDCGHVWAGCVATAMGSVMHYYQYPSQGTGSHSYYHPDYSTLTANFGSTSYNWSSMPNAIGGNNYQIAQLLYQCGVAVDMDYGPDGSGAYISDARNSMVSYFNYSPDANLKMKQGYTNTQWNNLLVTDLDLGRPLIYRGDDGSYGHAFVCDGYQTTSYFHFNWGWSGYGNGYFYTSNLNSGNGTYNYNQAAIFSVYPAVTIPVVDFEASTTIVTPGMTIDFTDLSQGFPSSWSWQFPGSNILASSAENPAGVSYSSTGLYNVSLTATNYLGSGSLTKTQYIEVVQGFCDLEFNNITINPSVMQPGDSLNLNFEIVNSSAYSAGSTTTAVYLSLDTIFNSLVDLSLATIATPQMLAYGAINISEQIAMPTLSNLGDYYIFVVANFTEDIPEQSTANNIVSTTISIAQADLVMQYPAVVPITTYADSVINITGTLKNTGTIKAGLNVLKFFLSTNSTYSANDEYLGNMVIDSILAGETIPVSETFVIPSTISAGNWYFLYVVDANENIEEQSEQNNTSSIQITILDLLPDLEMASFSISSQQVYQGGSVNLSYLIENSGLEVSGSCVINHYLSYDPNYNSSDTYLSSVSVAAINANDNLQLDYTLSIPEETTASNWYLLAVVDGNDAIEELNETNNIQSELIEVLQPLPDLIITEATATPENLETGGSVNVFCSVKNQGVELADESEVRFVISDDNIFDGQDVVLGSKPLFSLVSTAIANTSGDFTIPHEISTSNYKLLLVVDPGNSILESDELNNVFSIDVSIENTSSINDIGFMDFQLFPNPTSEYFSIDFDGIVSEIEISDSKGKLVRRIDVSNKTEIDISEFESGTYFVIIKSNKGISKAKKLIIEK